MRWFRFAVLVLVASLLQTGLVGALAVLRADFKPDLLLILLVFFALRCRSTDAIIAAFAIGFAADLSNPIAGRLMGPRIISFGLFGTLLSDVSGTLSPRRIVYQAITIFLMGCLTAGLSYLLMFLRTGSAPANMAAGCFWQPLYSAVLGPLLFLPIGWGMPMEGKGRRSYPRGALSRR
ncbi:MAG: rod shape-determining protein MreD [Planctomycetes bacterium]|nr:rod shape-determining protein MreD [Planctomycetota bacterium]